MLILMATFVTGVPLCWPTRDVHRYGFVLNEMRWSRMQQGTQSEVRWGRLIALMFLTCVNTIPTYFCSVSVFVRQRNEHHNSDNKSQNNRKIASATLTRHGNIVFRGAKLTKIICALCVHQQWCSSRRCARMRIYSHAPVPPSSSVLCSFSSLSFSMCVPTVNCQPSAFNCLLQSPLCSSWGVEQGSKFSQHKGNGIAQKFIDQISLAMVLVKIWVREV